MENNIFEIYRIYVELTDKMSSRRSIINSFYLTINTGLFATLAFVFKNSNLQTNYLILCSIVLICLGILICLIWFINILSFKQINRVKFNVIKEIEKKLAFAPYTMEWEIIKKDKNKYFRQTFIERTVPAVFIILHIIILTLILLNYENLYLP